MRDLIKEGVKERIGDRSSMEKYRRSPRHSTVRHAVRHQLVAKGSLGGLGHEGAMIFGLTTMNGVL
jgi:hypothetical protein